MGSYTPNHGFYLIDPTELVNVETDLNLNLDRADQRVRPLVEYQVTDEVSITNSTTLYKTTGAKWYKARSNSIFHYRDGTPFQDTNTVVQTWSFSGLTFEPGYENFDLDINRVAYVIEDGWVQWRGRVIATGKAELPLRTAVNFLNIPASVQPSASRYFFVPGGDATGNYQAFRVFFPASTDADKRVEFIGYGGASSGIDERYVSLNSIRYPLTALP